MADYNIQNKNENPKSIGKPLALYFAGHFGIGCIAKALSGYPCALKPVPYKVSFILYNRSVY
jgi:hypothetical protein